jgi:hypothetical protein
MNCEFCKGRAFEKFCTSSVLKGHGFSRAAIRFERPGALAPEEMYLFEIENVETGNAASILLSPRRRTTTPG